MFGTSLTPSTSERNLPRTTPLSIGDLDRQPLQITETVNIDAEPEEAWQAIADPTTWTRWFPGFNECRALDATSGVGATRLVHQDRFRVTEQIIAWEPGRLWGMTVLSINIPALSAMAETATLTPNNSGTTITWRVGATMRWWAKPAAGKLKRDTADNFTKASQQLEQLLTGGD